MAVDKQYDVVGIGNAIVDILSFCEESFLDQEKFNKGTMSLVDEAHSAKLYKGIASHKECSGGSVANTLAGLATLGARCGFIGKVADDTLGNIFTTDMRELGIDFDTNPTLEEVATANCLVFVTPDAQRTMATYLGACSLVKEEDIDEAMIKAAQILYFEGYLWDADHAKKAIRKGISAAKEAGCKVSFTLSDKFCIDRYRHEFVQLIKEDADIVFANEEEIHSLFETGDLQEAMRQLEQMCDMAVVTRSEKGCVLLTGGERLEVKTQKVSKVVDTTGAGDLFAAGFLYGVIKNYSPEDAAKLGNACAGRIITQLGARSDASLEELVA